MKHNEIKELLPLYIDGGLDTDEVEFVETHLASCPECRELLKRYQENYDFLTSAEDVEVSADFLNTVMKRVESEKRAIKPIHEESSWWERLFEMFKVRLQIPVGALGVALAAVLLIMLIGPLGNLGLQQPSDQAEEYSKQNELFYDGQKAEGLQPAPAPLAKQSMEFSAADRSSAANTPTPSAAPTSVERKIIKTANLRLEVKDLKNADKRLLDVVKNYDGFIANSSSWVTDNQHFSSYQVRVPADQFYQALSKIEELGESKFRALGGQDVTEEYIDISSRLKNLKLQEERYREILRKAGAVKDILEVERQLERVRGEIESLQGRIIYLDNQVNLSTIDIELAEPQPIGSTNWGIVKAFREALNAMIGTFYRMIVGLGQLLPYVALILFAYVLYRVVRRRRKK